MTLILASAFAALAAFASKYYMHHTHTHIWLAAAEQIQQSFG